MPAAAGSPGWSCRPIADMRRNADRGYGQKTDLAAIWAVAFIFLAPLQAMAQTGGTDQLPPRTAEETTADLQLVLDRHIAESRCEDPATELMRHIGPVIAQLSKTAILYAIPCTVGAFNVSYRLYRRETGEIGGVETLYFATWSQEHGWGGTDLLLNIDADGPRLSAFSKTRSPGDCGNTAQWLWSDNAYRLMRYTAQDTCAGTVDENWPVIFEYRQNGNENGSAQ